MYALMPTARVNSPKDKLHQIFTNTNPTSVTTNYDLFGAPMPGRSYTSSTGYRYGYQNQEKLDELYGDGNAYSFEYRISDARLGRFLSTDPLEMDYPWNSPYAFGENRVIDGTELEGLEWQPTDDKGNNVSANADNIAGYTWVGYDKFAYQNKDGSISSSPQGDDSKKIGIHAPEGTVATGYTFDGNSARKYTSDQFTLSGKISMATLSGTETEKINNLDPAIQDKARKFLLKTKLDFDYDLQIAQGRRDDQGQNLLYAKGRTQAELTAAGIFGVTAQPNEKKVTYAKAGQSPHSFGLAFDIAKKTNPLYDGLDWNALQRTGNSVGLEWGGIWPGKKKDQPHFQVPNWKTLIPR